MGPRTLDNVSPAILNSYRLLLGALTSLSWSSPNCSTPVTVLQSPQSPSHSRGGGGSIACSCILEGPVSLGCKSLQSTDMNPGLHFSIRRHSELSRRAIVQHICFTRVGWLDASRCLTERSSTQFFHVQPNHPGGVLHDFGKRLTLHNNSNINVCYR